MDKKAKWNNEIRYLRDKMEKDINDYANRTTQVTNKKIAKKQKKIDEFDPNKDLTKFEIAQIKYINLYKAGQFKKCIGHLCIFNVHDDKYIVYKYYDKYHNEFFDLHDKAYQQFSALCDNHNSFMIRLGCTCFINTYSCEICNEEEKFYDQD